MIGRILFAAVLAGIAAGFVMSAVQMWRVVPLIHAAEQFEDEHAHAQDHAQDAEHGHADEAHDHAHAGWMPADGAERAAFTVLANVVTGVGFALVLVAAATFTGRPVTPANGVVWGLIGFIVFALAPAAGLPPQAPGAAIAEVGARQGWWLATVVATAAGIAALVLWPNVVARLAGLVLIALPHIVGAPQPAELDGTVPGELASRFVAASLVASAIFWVSLGVIAGWLLTRETDEATA